MKDPTLTYFAACEGYLDQAEGHRNSRKRVKKLFGSQYLVDYERGIEDAKKYYKGPTHGFES